MSDAKWRKVLRAIANTASNVRRCEYKSIDAEHISTNRVPGMNDIDDHRFADAAFQPFEYKWIEWMRFPRRYRPTPKESYIVVQDVETLQTEIKNAADAMMKLDDEHLWLFGYSGLIGHD